MFFFPRVVCFMFHVRSFVPLWSFLWSFFLYPMFLKRRSEARLILSDCFVCVVVLMLCRVLSEFVGLDVGLDGEFVKEVGFVWELGVG